MVKQVVISTNNGLLLGVIVLGGKVISFNDLLWNKKQKIFYVKDVSSICEASEIQRLEKAINEKTYFKKQQIVTNKDKKLGKLEDCLIDPIHGVLIALIAKENKWIRPKQFFVHKNNILSSDASVVIVRDIRVADKVTKKAAPKLRTALSK